MIGKIHELKKRPNFKFYFSQVPKEEKKSSDVTGFG